MIDFSSWGSGDKTKEKLELIDRSFSESKIVCFDYSNLSGEYSNRVVEPIKLIFKSFNWYLYGFCLSKMDMRIFKIKRMTNLRLGDKNVEDREYSLDGFFDNNTNKLITLKLKSNKDFLRKVDDYFDEYSIVGNVIEVNLPEDEWIYSMILGLGSNVEVIEPESFRNIIKKRIKEMNILYK